MVDGGCGGVVRVEMSCGCRGWDRVEGVSGEDCGVGMGKYEKLGKFWWR